MSRCLPGLEDVPSVTTTAFALAQHNLAWAVRKHDIGVLSGPAGCGKTYALDHFLTHSPAMSGLRHTYLEMPPDPAAKEVSVRLLNAIVGGCDNKQPAYLLMDELVAALSGTSHVVVIDEAHNLGVKGLQRLRYLHQRGEFSWTLILTGSTFAEALVGADEMRSRTEGLVMFAPLKGGELLASLKAMHPLLAASSNDALRYVDAQFCRGKFREWAKFLRVAKELAPKLKVDQLSDKLISASLAAVGADAWRLAGKS
jgi:predicted AAA+ superfamily ATPase